MTHQEHKYLALTATIKLNESQFGRFYKALIVILCTLTIGCDMQESNEAVSVYNEHISTIKKKYVKDKRTAYFNIVTERQGSQVVLKGETAIGKAKQELIDLLKDENLDFVDSTHVLPSEELGDKTYGVVNVSVCNIRSNAKHSAELATQALLGTPLRVWKKQGDFYFIQTPDDYFGWVDDGGLTLFNKEEFNDWQSSERAVVLNDFNFLMKEPNLSSVKVSDLTAGGILKIVDKEKGYFKLSFPDGRSGYLLEEEVLPYSTWLQSRNANAENILASAYEFLGRPYLWGGTSGKGVDCSGFTKTVYYLNGIQLERDASLQVHNGILVETDTASWENLLPGDLMFFGRHASKDKKERITHVAIYMGDGKIIHSSDRVKIESLIRGEPTFVEKRVKTFIRAKRVIGSEGKNGIIALKESEWYN